MLRCVFIAPESFRTAAEGFFVGRRSRYNVSEMAALKRNLTAHRDAITIIGTVGYSIDPTAKGWWSANSPGIESFNDEMKAMGFRVHPLIGGLRGNLSHICNATTSSNECQIQHFRKIWASPQRFIERAVELIKQGGWDGVNIDFESGAGTAQDAQSFAVFLKKLADAVHAVGARVSVDTNCAPHYVVHSLQLPPYLPGPDLRSVTCCAPGFPGGPYLNPGTLSTGNTVDTFCDMQTYGLHDTDFEGDLKRDSNLTTMKRYGLGVCPTCCNPCLDVELKPPRQTRWHTKNLTKRFDFATRMGVREVDIWMDLAIGDTCDDVRGGDCWWNQVKTWLQTP